MSGRLKKNIYYIKVINFQVKKNVLKKQKSCSKCITLFIIS